MSRCLKPAEVDAWVRGKLPEKKATTIREHASACAACRALLAEAAANQEWLHRLTASREFRDIRERMAATSLAPPTTG